MQLKPITAILLLVLASLLISGCTVTTPFTSSPTPTVTPTATTPTPTPILDHSSDLTTAFESGNFIMERPFTKSINERGNDVYKGVRRNVTASDAPSVTVVIEFTKSEAQAKTVYDNAVALKKNQGYVLDASLTAYGKANCPQCKDLWEGTYNLYDVFTCQYDYVPHFQSWLVTQQTSKVKV